MHALARTATRERIATAKQLLKQARQVQIVRIDAGATHSECDVCLVVIVVGALQQRVRAASIHGRRCCRRATRRRSRRQCTEIALRQRM